MYQLKSWKALLPPGRHAPLDALILTQGARLAPSKLDGHGFHWAGLNGEDREARKRYLCVMVKTPSHPDEGSSKR